MKNTRIKIKNPVSDRLARLIQEYPDIPRNVLHDIFRAGVEAKGDELNLEVFEKWLEPGLVEVIEEPSKNIVNRLFNW